MFIQIFIENQKIIELSRNEEIQYVFIINKKQRRKHDLEKVFDFQTHLQIYFGIINCGLQAFFIENYPRIRSNVENETLDICGSSLG